MVGEGKIPDQLRIISSKIGIPSDVWKLVFGIAAISVTAGICHWLARVRHRSKRVAHLFSPELRKLCRLFSEQGFSIRVVGGACRDTLQGRPPRDMDLATDCPPDALAHVCTACRLKYKIMHSCDGDAVTTVIIWMPQANKQGGWVEFELTALRGDISTSFETSWRSDALHRDFTMNAMSVSEDGLLHDYFDGVEHLKQHRVVWVGDVRQRILEAPSRVLRYFRFHGEMVSSFGHLAVPHDIVVLQQMADVRSSLRNVPGEVVWKLMRQIIIESGRSAVEAELAPMIEHGFMAELTELIRLSVSSFDMHAAAKVRALQEDFKSLVKVDPVLTFVKLFCCNEVVVASAAKAWCWSKSDARLGAFLCSELTRGERLPMSTCRVLLRERDGLDPKGVPCSWIQQVFIAQERFQELEDVAKLENVIFPLKSDQLQEYARRNGYPEFGISALGGTMKALRQEWINGGCKTSAAELLASGAWEQSLQ